VTKINATVKKRNSVRLSKFKQLVERNKLRWLYRPCRHSIRKRDGRLLQLSCVPTLG